MTRARATDVSATGASWTGPKAVRRAVAAALLAALAALPALGGCGGEPGAGAGESPGASGSPASGAARAGPGGSLAGTVLPEPMPKGDFTLTATDGEPYRFARETEGYVTVVFFGYTHCPDVCPVTMANLGAAMDRVPPAVEEEVKVVFVTTDPARDSLARIRSWLDRFDPSFVGLRGPLEEVNRIMGTYGLPGAVKEQPGREEDYTVGHAGHVLVFSPEGPLRILYSARTRQRQWVRDLSRLATEGFPEPPAAVGNDPAGGAAGAGAAPEGMAGSRGSSPASAAGRARDDGAGG